MSEYIKNMPAGGVLGNAPLSLKSDSTRSFNIKSGLSVRSGVWDPLNLSSLNTRWVADQGVDFGQGIADDSSYNNIAILRNGASLETSSAGVGSKVVNLDGIDDYVEIDDTFQGVIGGDHVISFWLNVYTDFNNWRNQYIFSTFDGSANGGLGAWGVGMYIDSNGSLNWHAVGTPGTSDVYSLQRAFVFQNNVGWSGWTNIILHVGNKAENTQSGGGTSKYWINGVAGVAAYGGNRSWSLNGATFANDTTAYTSSNKLVLGKKYVDYPDHHNNNLRGKIADFQIYSGQFTDTNAASVYAGGQGNYLSTNLKGLWTFSATTSAEPTGEVDDWTPAATKTGAGALKRNGYVDQHSSYQLGPAGNQKPYIRLGSGTIGRNKIKMDNGTSKILNDGKAHAFFVIRFVSTTVNTGTFLSSNYGHSHSVHINDTYSPVKDINGYGMELENEVHGGILKIKHTLRQSGSTPNSYFSHDKFATGSTQHTDWFILEYSYDSGPEMIINGSAMAQTTPSATYPADIPANNQVTKMLYLGGDKADVGGETSPLVDIAEAIFYDGKLSAGEATNIRNYLSAVYAIDVD